MRKINLLFLSMLLLLSIHSTAQLNYLFSAEKKTYVPVTGGITPPMVTDNPAWEVEDEGFARIPIGFKFKYDGNEYSKVNVSVNGFVTLGDTFTTRAQVPLFINSLAQGPFGYGGERPIIAPFWDDLLLTDSLNLVYKTTGQRPNRVFTIEWKKIKWVYTSVAPVLSFELKLYENTNIIEFHYKDEGSLPDPRFAFASIGLTSSYYNRGIISLQSTSSHPDISMLKPQDSLAKKPVTNQVYRFTPASTEIPDALQSSISYTHKTVSFELDADDDHGHNRINDNESNGRNGHHHHDNYEYAITRSPVAPSSGRRTSSSDITISSLSPATTYYLYARSIDRDELSQWTAYSFTTAVRPVETPYQVSGNVPPGALLPADLRIQNFMDTIRLYGSYNDWQVWVDFPAPGDISALELNLNFYNADSWLFTPGVKLRGGKTYQLKFSYVSYYTNAPGERAGLVVKYGKATGQAAMDHRLFKNLDIRTYADYDEYGGLPKNDTIIEITPHQSDEYYFGFHNLTPLDGAVLIVSNISIIEKEESCNREMPLTLNGATNNTDNFLNWQATAIEDESVYEMQSSTDGINFKKIGSVNTETAGSSNNQTTKVRYKIVKTETEQETINVKKGNSKNTDQINITNYKRRFELQRSEDGVNFTKVSAGKPIASKANNGIKNQPTTYADRKVMKGVIYYRLQQTAKNGSVKFSNIVTLETKGISINKVYPNPVIATLNVEVTSPDAGKVNLLVTDINGKTVINKTANVWKGENNLQIETGNLRAGSYIVKVVCANGCESAVKKFVKE